MDRFSSCILLVINILYHWLLHCRRSHPCTVNWYTTLYFTVLQCILLQCTALHCTINCFTALYSTLLQCADTSLKCRQSPAEFCGGAAEQLIWLLAQSCFWKKKGWESFFTNSALWAQLSPTWPSGPSWSSSGHIRVSLRVCLSHSHAIFFAWSDGCVPEWTESEFLRGPSPLFGADRWSRVEP